MIFRPLTLLVLVTAMIAIWSCKPDRINTTVEVPHRSAEEILGNPEFLAIAYGGYRAGTRDIQPEISELKEDMRILAAMGVHMLRTYNVHLPHAENVLKAITELQEEDGAFEMYVMLGAWIDCENAWQPGQENHEGESPRNAIEIAEAVRLTQQYPDIVKVIAVGNESMVHWAQSYFVRPKAILGWVNHLRDLRSSGELPSDLWLTSSDNYASWGGADPIYHTDDLNALIHAVDFLSVHTYPMHETHYNYEFWLQRPEEADIDKDEKIVRAMDRALLEAQKQVAAVQSYMDKIGEDRPIHIGETGWATVSDEFYGDSGSRACDQYKQGLYYKLIRDWTNEAGISCFFFEAFDERWKDDKNPNGSENHFGLIDENGQAKYAIWDLVENGTFKGLTRDGEVITKSFRGDPLTVKQASLSPPVEYDNGL